MSKFSCSAKCFARLGLCCEESGQKVEEQVFINLAWFSSTAKAKTLVGWLVNLLISSFLGIFENQAAALVLYITKLGIVSVEGNICCV